MSTKPKQSTLSPKELANLTSLKPGTVVDMQITTPVSTKRVKTQFVGLQLPPCLIFQYPNQNRWGVLKDFLKQGASIVIRYVLEGASGEVIAFKVEVLRAISRPSEMLFTTVPETMQSMGLRAERRSTPGIAVKVKVKHEGQSIADQGLIIDVSSNGCRIAMEISPEFPPIELENKMDLELEIGEKKGDLHAIVKNRRQDKHYIYYGLQFVDKVSIVNELLRRHILIE